MRVNDAWDHYYTHSATTSANVRKLGFTGIALVWIFSGGSVSNVDEIQISGDLRWPLLLLVAALAVDFVQYLVLTIFWHWFARTSEKEHETSDEFRAPDWINRAGEIAFYLKVMLTVVGYGWLIVTLTQRLF